MTDFASPAYLLFAAGTLTVAASSPMFLSHFRHAVATTRPPVKTPGVAGLFVAETVKCALFSGMAAWAGARTAVSAGLSPGITSPWRCSSPSSRA